MYFGDYNVVQCAKRMQGLHSAMARAIAMTFAVAASGGLGGTIESAGGGHAKRAALRAGFQHTCRPHECCNANSACLRVCCLMIVFFKNAILYFLSVYKSCVAGGRSRRGFLFSSKTQSYIC